MTSEGVQLSGWVQPMGCRKVDDPESKVNDLEWTILSGRSLCRRSWEDRDPNDCKPWWIYILRVDLDLKWTILRKESKVDDPDKKTILSQKWTILGLLERWTILTQIDESIERMSTIIGWNWIVMKLTIERKWPRLFVTSTWLWSFERSKWYFTKNFLDNSNEMLF